MARVPALFLSSQSFPRFFPPRSLGWLAVASTPPFGGRKPVPPFRVESPRGLPQEGREEAASPRLFPAGPWAENKRSVCFRATALCFRCTMYQIMARSTPYRICVRPSFLRCGFVFSSSFIFSHALRHHLPWDTPRHDPARAVEQKSPLRQQAALEAERKDHRMARNLGQHTDEHKLLLISLFAFFPQHQSIPTIKCR